MSINEAMAKAELEKNNGKVWTTGEMQAEFTVSNFLAPFVTVTRKRDGAKGTLMFTHRPRFYFKFEPTESEEPRPLGLYDCYEMER